METTSRADVRTVEAVDGVHLTQLAVGDEASVQHFRIDPGAAVPEHDHPHEQVGYLVRGTLTFVIDGEETVVAAGDSYAIPGEERHAVENGGDEPAEGIDVFSPPRADPDWLSAED
ncbi:MAG: cupin domain-containing protein [Haloarculaceae archaeon]